ncbi:MAG: ATP-dependent Clp protease ATP-binding subunit [Methanobacteriota archaeon]|nr:MAG: ATP-dependent Clp protease ATP-binding subunit [Euryarchaeota archaeon]
MFFENDILDIDRFGDERTQNILIAATDRAQNKLRPSDILAAVIDNGDTRILTILSQAMEPGVTPNDLREVIEVYNPASDTPSDFDGRREHFSPEVLAALNQLEKEIRSTNENSISLELFLSCVLNHLEEEDLEYLTPLDAKRASELYRKQVETIRQVLTPLFDDQTGSGQLRNSQFTVDAWRIMEHAAIQATELGYEQILPPHCFLALLGETEGVLEEMIRLQALPEITPSRISTEVSRNFRIGERKSTPVPLTRDGIAETTHNLLKNAQRIAQLWGMTVEEPIDRAHLLLAILENMPPRLADVLIREPLNLNLEKMHRHLENYLLELQSGRPQEVAFLLPKGLLPSEDFTYLARIGQIPEALHIEAYLEPIEKALHRRTQNHVLLTGMRGVGKTTIAKDIARRAAIGEIPFLKGKRFLWVDCQSVAPGESLDKLEGIVTYTSGREDLVLILDDMANLLRSNSNSEENKSVLRELLKGKSIQVIGILSHRDYEEFLSSDEQMLSFFTRIPVKEPEETVAIDIVKQASAQLPKEFDVTIEEKAIERAVVLSSNFIMNERLPAKAIKILRRICEDIEYYRSKREAVEERITVEHVIRVVSEISGVPQATVSGIGQKEDFEAVLAEEVIGQEEAIKAVGEELRLIKAGLSDPSKPASVMFFAGLTGVGKTELAKTIAKIYSSSKKLQTYTMGNFTEPHSVSGIIGVPPGYVGHEQGGRLINDINADPYCVFLLDEAEKAHPEVWKPFLNLFDEGWIDDQRGIRAYADRSIFILTSNAGDEMIAESAARGESIEEITRKVRQILAAIKHERTGQRVFTPEFLARLKRIIVFKPLDKKAMEGITRKLIKLMQKTWQEKREKTIIVPDNLIHYIAERSHEENQNSGNKEGARIVRKKISEWVEATIQKEASQKEEEYKGCDVIELNFLSPGDSTESFSTMKPKITVTFRKQKPLTPEEAITDSLEKLKNIYAQVADEQISIVDRVSRCFEQLQQELNHWKREHPGESVEKEIQEFINQFEKLCSKLDRIAQKKEKDSIDAVRKFVEQALKAKEESINES